MTAEHLGRYRLYDPGGAVLASGQAALDGWQPGLTVRWLGWPLALLPLNTPSSRALLAESISDSRSARSMSGNTETSSTLTSNEPAIPLRQPGVQPERPGRRERRRRRLVD